jgi:hypothetical protein
MRLILFALAWSALAVAGVAACGGSNQSTHDGTTVTIEKPAGSTAPPPAPSK